MADGIQANLGAGGPLIAAKEIATGPSVQLPRNSLIDETTLNSLKIVLRDAVAGLTDSGIFAFGIRRETDTSPVDTDGDIHPFCFNQAGRLKVSTQPAATAASTGTITAAAQSVSVSSARQGVVILSLVGTFSGGFAFEGSLDSTDGSNGNWFSLQASRSNSGTLETASGALTNTPAYAWKIAAAPWAYIRVRCTAIASGSVSVTFAVGANSFEPAPGVQALAAGSASIGNVATVATVTTITNNVKAVATPVTTGGTTTGKIISAATTNATSLKASAGQLYGAQFSNSGTGWAFVKFYNKASAPTVGTDTPVEIVGIPPGGYREINRSSGSAASLGIAYAITGAYADSDTTAVALGQVVGSIQYF